MCRGLRCGAEPVEKANVLCGAGEDYIQGREFVSVFIKAHVSKEFKLTCRVE